MDKNIKVNQTLWRRLQLLKIDGNYSKLGDLIEDMMAAYEKKILPAIDSGEAYASPSQTEGLMTEGKHDDSDQ